MFEKNLSCRRLGKFPRYLAGALEINWIIAIADKNIHSAIFKLTKT
jgi:hypothetical protein